ncbi:glycosyltransferase [Oleiphilus messinensis]|uniref:Glycosyltransferase n=1 Tax=Oleiphilus messinensis TaxID=141451 RepID=A0A1Y0I404_9GAMM|nr:glycosyltransferase [Oleiphilus messinensis]ARU55228.1 glycosyltransferase [Oleiphilus messinensis]
MKKRPVHVQVVQHLAPGGIETMSLDLKQFANAEVEVHIVSLEGSKAEMIARWPRLASISESLHFLEKPQGVAPKTVWRLFRLLLRLRASLVHTHHIGPLLYGGFAARLAGVQQIIHTEHDAWHLENNKHQRLMRHSVKLFRPTVVADAQLVARKLEEKVSCAAPRIIHNGINTQRFIPGDQRLARKALALPRDKWLVGCAARLQDVKGHDVLLDALFRLPRQVHVVLAGTGPAESALRQQVMDLNLSGRVHFLGHLDDMPSFYQALDVFCLASHHEGMPLSPLEAQACGAPVVLSDVGACSETVCPATGLLFPAGDSAALGRALERQRKQAPGISPRDFVVRARDVRRMIRNYQSLTSGI